jgi:hypothetical protein
MIAVMGWLGSACNSGIPEPASMTIPSTNLALAIVRVATDPFLSRHNLTLSIQSEGGCSATAELFPDTGHAGRRNVYLTGPGLIYVVGEFDARVIDSDRCRITLSEFRHLARDVVFLGSFDEDRDGRWTYFPASQRPEQPLGSR